MYIIFMLLHILAYQVQIESWNNWLRQLLSHTLEFLSAFLFIYPCLFLSAEYLNTVCIRQDNSCPGIQQINIDFLGLSTFQSSFFHIVASSVFVWLPRFIVNDVLYEIGMHRSFSFSLTYLLNNTHLICCIKIRFWQHFL